MTASLLATPVTPGSRYLLLGQEEFHEHRSAVACLQVSPGGLIASADASGVVKVGHTEVYIHGSAPGFRISPSSAPILVTIFFRH